jgi:hypothetical protein
MWRRRSLLVLAASATLAFALASAPAQASTSRVSYGDGQTGSPAVAPAAGMRCAPSSGGSSGVQRCVSVKFAPFSASALAPAERTRRNAAIAQMAAAAKSGNTRQMTAMPLRQAAIPAAGLGVAPPQCEFDSSAGYVNTPDRLTSCLDQIGILTDLVCEDGDCEPSGSFTFEDEQWLSFSASASTSSTWNHGMNTFAYSGEGDLAKGVSANVHSGCWEAANVCDAISLTLPDPQTVQLLPGSSYSFEWSESDDGLSATQAGEYNPLDDYQVLGAWWYTDQSFALDVGLPGRCDSISKSTDGCVDESYIPTLQLPISQYGASATMIAWAQQNLSGHWGLQGEGQPMHYLSDDIVQQNNREAICPDPPAFPRDPSITSALAPYGDKDSCDEFPFAGSFESGAMPESWGGDPKPYVTTGDDCAQITAVQTGTSGTNEAADWSIIQVTAPHH